MIITVLHFGCKEIKAQRISNLSTGLEMDGSELDISF